MNESPTNGPAEGLWIESIGGYCPCQAGGTFFGHPFYFRARHGEWTLDVANPGKDPVLPEHAIMHREGDDRTEGYMEPEAALLIIFFCWSEFRRRLLAGLLQPHGMALTQPDSSGDNHG